MNALLFTDRHLSLILIPSLRQASHKDVATLPPDPMDSHNNPSPLLSHAHAPSQSSSEERPCGHVATLASYEKCSMPPVNDSNTPPLSSVGSSSEERPDCSVKGACLRRFTSNLEHTILDILGAYLTP
ncbi:hypothetical protein K438DRAFT_1961993 [Mycena galopus ATCC 62051]|nr:hypothetical protein K438DRAFT_1961993 [Mycena galopus ATCC 62051]